MNMSIRVSSTSASVGRKTALRPTSLITCIIGCGGAFPIGDDDGDEVLFYARGHRGYRLYHVGFGNLNLKDAVWTAATLEDFLTKANGIETA